MNKSLKEFGGLGKIIRDRNMEVLNVHALKGVRETMEKDGVLFDIGGGYLRAEDKQFKEDVNKAILSKSILIGLLPFEDEEESMKLLSAREKARPQYKDKAPEEIDKRSREHYPDVAKGMKEITKHLFYVGDKTPEEISELLYNYINKHILAE